MKCGFVAFSVKSIVPFAMGYAVYLPPNLSNFRVLT